MIIASDFDVLVPKVLELFFSAAAAVVVVILLVLLVVNVLKGTNSLCSSKSLCALHTKRSSAVQKRRQTTSSTFVYLFTLVAY